MSASRLLRLLVAVALTAFVLYNAHPAEVLRAAAHARLDWIAAAIGLVLIDRTLMALRWIDLLSALTPGSRPRFPIVLRIFFVSSFVSNFVPSVAADMYRAYALARHDVRMAESTASVLMDRVLGVLSMVIVGAAALPTLSSADALRTLSGADALRASSGADAARGIAAGLVLAGAACAVVALVLFSERAASLVQRAASLAPWSRVPRVAASLTDAVRRYATHHGALVRVLVMSILVQAARVLQAWCLGRSLGIELPLATYFAFIPAIVLIMQLPITINGIGTTQVAFDRFFGAAGVAAAPVFALSILFLALGVVGSLPGGLIYAMTPASAAPQRAGRTDSDGLG